jgi:hypothetical protein
VQLLPLPGALADQLRPIVVIVWLGEVKLVGADGALLELVQFRGAAGVVTDTLAVSALTLLFLSNAVTAYW